MESTSLFLTSNNYETSTGDYVLRFNSSQQLIKQQIALVQSNIYKQWFNISSSLQNNKITITVPLSVSYPSDPSLDGVITKNTEDWLIPDGFYTIATLNSSFQKWCDLSPTTRKTPIRGAYPFVLSFSVDEKVVLKANASFLLVRGSTTIYFTQFCSTRLNTTQLGDFLGMDTLLFAINQSSTNVPPISTLSYYGTSKPQENPISSVVFNCNLLYNPIVNVPRGILSASFIGDTDFGSSTSSADSKLTWLDIVDGPYSEIRISTYSQNGIKLNYIDTNSVFQIALRKK